MTPRTPEELEARIKSKLNPPTMALEAEEDVEDEEDEEGSEPPPRSRQQGSRRFR